MNGTKINEAIRQMCTHCDLKMRDYEPVSARGVLYELGFGEDEAETVLEYLDANGFTYCLDRFYGNRPSAQACYWGPDQLKSRLEFVA